MSRVQNILDKAEREWSHRRVHTTVPPPAPASLAYEAPAAPIVSDIDLAAPIADEEPIAATRRVLSGTPLDPLLVAASAPSAVAAEQYRALRTRLVHADHGA